MVCAGAHSVTSHHTARAHTHARSFFETPPETTCYRRVPQSAAAKCDDATLVLIGGGRGNPRRSRAEDARAQLRGEQTGDDAHNIR